MIQDVASIADSIIAAVIYDIAKPAGVGYHTEKQEKILRDALTKYLQNEEQRFGTDGAAILAEVQGRISTAQAYRNALKASCNREKLLKLWMEGYSGAFPQEVGTVCGGCVDIVIAYVKMWPEYVPDITTQTLAEVQELKEIVLRVLNILSELNFPLADYPTIPEEDIHKKAYLRKWTDNLFLNNSAADFDAKPVAAHELYIPLSFRFGKDKKPREDKDNLLWSRLSRPGGHLVLGDPGIGKSTLIARYLAEQGEVSSILAYPLTEFELTGEKKHPGELLLQKIGRTAESLKNTVLFLDGLDECAITPENRAALLCLLVADWGNTFPWVVTCRLNSIPEDALDALRDRLPIFTLCPLNPEQIGRFMDKYQAKTGEQIADTTRATLTAKEQNGVFGIPLILYLIVASRLEISPGDTLVTVYDKLFGEDSPFYHRSYDLQRHSLSKAYIRKIRQMSRDIALYMLLHESERAIIPEKEYRAIEAACGGAEEGEPLLDTFLHRGIVEGQGELCFVHRTMYEYFVAEGFVSLAVAAKTPEELSGVIGWYWHREQMSTTIAQYVREKLEQKKRALTLSRWEDAGLRLMEKGVRRCQPKPAWLKKMQNRKPPACLRFSEGKTLEEDRRRENVAFWNLCRLLVWVREMTGTSDLVFQRFGKPPEALVSAIRHCAADYSPVFCPNFFLFGARLTSAVLSHAHLIGTDLSGANLTGTHLDGADLTHANLNGAFLTHVNLTHANLTGAYLTEEQVKSLGFQMLSSCIFDEIHVFNYNHGFITYPRPDFFARFFPDK